MQNNDLWELGRARQWRIKQKPRQDGLCGHFYAS
jgi:hypothetical protein